MQLAYLIRYLAVMLQKERNGSGKFIAKLYYHNAVNIRYVRARWRQHSNEEGCAVNIEEKANTVGADAVKENKKQSHNVKCAFTLYITNELAERIRSAVYWTPGLSVSKFAEEALDVAINRLEEAQGAPFEEREGGMRRGKML